MSLKESYRTTKHWLGGQKLEEVTAKRLNKWAGQVALGFTAHGNGILHQEIGLFLFNFGYIQTFVSVFVLFKTPTLII